MLMLLLLLLFVFKLSFGLDDVTWRTGEDGCSAMTSSLFRVICEMALRGFGGTGGEILKDLGGTGGGSPSRRNSDEDKADEEEEDEYADEANDEVVEMEDVIVPLMLYLIPLLLLLLTFCFSIWPKVMRAATSKAEKAERVEFLALVSTYKAHPDC